VELIRAWLAEKDILLAGRYSEWEYYNSDHAFIAGRKAAEAAMQKKQEQSRNSLRVPPSLAASLVRPSGD
jgi:UDP-galactopyranose mutase